MIDLANDDTHGYDQTNRWGPNYDCASSIITAWQTAGVPVKTNGVTKTAAIKAYQTILGVTADGSFDSLSKAAVTALVW